MYAVNTFCLLQRAQLQDEHRHTVQSTYTVPPNCFYSDFVIVKAPYIT